MSSGTRRAVTVQQGCDLAYGPQKTVAMLERPDTEALASGAIVFPDRLTRSTESLRKFLSKNVIATGGDLRQGRGQGSCFLHRRSSVEVDAALRLFAVIRVAAISD